MTRRAIVSQSAIRNPQSAILSEALCDQTHHRRDGLCCPGALTGPATISEAVRTYAHQLSDAELPAIRGWSCWGPVSPQHHHHLHVHRVDSERGQPQLDCILAVSRVEQGRALGEGACSELALRTGF